MPTERDVLNGVQPRLNGVHQKRDLFSLIPAVTFHR